MSAALAVLRKLALQEFENPAVRAAARTLFIAAIAVAVHGLGY